MTSELTKTAVAIHLDMSDSNLTNVLRGLNMDFRTNTLDEIRTAYIRDLREKAAGRANTEANEQLIIERVRETKANADYKEFQLARECGKYVPVEEIEPFITSNIVAAKQEFLFLPKKWSQEIKSMFGLEIEEVFFIDGIHGALNKLASSLQDDNAGNEDAEQEGLEV